MNRPTWSLSTNASACVLLLVFLLYLSPALSLYCTKCKPNHPGCRNGNYEAQHCEGNATHCFTLQLFIPPHGYGTSRGCMNRDNDRDECKVVEIGGFNVTGCITVCDWNGCNSAIRNPRPWQEG